MKEDYWQQRWQANEIGFNQPQPNRLLQRYFDSLNLKPGARILVPLCGKSIDMLWLANQGYEILGIEFSSIACEAFFTENNLPFTLIKEDKFSLFQSDKIILMAGDFFHLSQSMIGKIDVVYDRAALIALPPELRKAYAHHLVELLVPDTAILLITTVYNQSEMAGPPFSVGEVEVRQLYSSYQIKQLYNKALSEIPDHLQNKGLAHAQEQLYLLRSRTFYYLTEIS